MTVDSSKKGPIEAGVWAERLPANVATAGPCQRVRGYSSVSDLGKNYDFIEYAAIALGLPPPSEQWGVAINLALVALGATSVADAPVHAATLAARFGVPARVSLAVGMLGLAEQASEVLVGAGEEQDPSDELWEALPSEIRDEFAGRVGGQRDLALEVLRRAGLRSETQLIALLCISRLPILAAEVDATTAGDLKGYPMRLPDFEYGDEE